MRGGTGTCAETDFEGAHIGDKDDQADLTSNCEVGDIVGEALL